MPRMPEAVTLTQLLSARPPSTRRAATMAARRAAARLALTLGVSSSCVGLGLLVGQLGRALLGG